MISVNMQSKPAREPDIAAIKRLGQEYFDATNAGDAERCIATMSDETEHSSRARAGMSSNRVTAGWRRKVRRRRTHPETAIIVATVRSTRNDASRGKTGLVWLTAYVSGIEVARQRTFRS